MAAVIYRGSRLQFRQLMRLAVQAISGRTGDPHGIARGIQLRAGIALLSQVQQAFIVKSRGGVGSDGIRWQPLKRETIAQRRTTTAERKAAGLTKANRNRGLLTDAENLRWKKIYGSRLARFRIMGVADAEAKAAQIAWATLKREGAKTKLELFGGRTVEILRDTGELFRSLTPGVEDQPSHAEGQILRLLPPGLVIVGTNKKPWHHRGIPGKLPARPLWPLNGRLPQSWWDAVNKATLRGLFRAVTLLAERGAK